MFFSSVALYLFVRKSSLLKIPTQFSNLAMFGIPLFLFIFMGLITHQNFSLPLYQYVIIIIAAIFFSYLGNVSSLLSIEYAPNPGYSLVISKSYVVFTTLVAVLFLNAELTVRKVIAIGFIVFFSALIMLSQKRLKKIVNKLWLPLSFGAFFGWGFLSLTSKYIFNQGTNVYVFLTYIYLIVTSCILIEIAKKRIRIIPKKNNLWILILIGIFSTGFNLFQFLSIQSAPNIGYVNAINASSISIVTILAIILFKDEFSKKKLLGVLGVTIGLLLLLI